MEWTFVFQTRDILSTLVATPLSKKHHLWLFIRWQTACSPVSKLGVSAFVCPACSLPCYIFSKARCWTKAPLQTASCPVTLLHRLPGPRLAVLGLAVPRLAVSRLAVPNLCALCTSWLLISAFQQQLGQSIQQGFDKMFLSLSKHVSGSQVNIMAIVGMVVECARSYWQHLPSLQCTGFVLPAISSRYWHEGNLLGAYFTMGHGL